jgi:hypothetical protein
MTEALFWTSLVMSVASLGVFVLVAYSAAFPRQSSAPANPMDAGPHGRSVALPNASDLASGFAKAGPAATAAALSIFFMFVALVVSGVVELSVETKPEAEAAVTQ